MHNKDLEFVISCISEVSWQIEGLDANSATSDLLIWGTGSVFDSFSTLVLLVEMEQRIDPDLLAGRSLVEWHSSLYLEADTQLNIEKFTTLLFDDFLRVTS